MLRKRLLANHQPPYGLLLGLLCGFLFFYGLGRLPFLGPDEPRYAQVAREMYASGDWITPRLVGMHWFEKPALTYWLAALGYTLFGVTEWAARCGNALLACASVFLLYRFGRGVKSAQAGFLGAAVLASMGIWIGFARAATFDLPLAACMALALCSFYRWTQAPTQTRHWWLFCAGLGLAVLAKGLVGLILPVGIIVPYALLTQQWRSNVWQATSPKLLFKLFIGGTLLFSAIVATWYAPMFWRHGQEFINEFFIAHHFQRYTSNKFKHPQPVYFFPFVLIAGCLPWSAFFALSMTRLKRTLLQDQLRLFLWLWVIVPVVFFSLSGSKLPGYILPVFPAAALLIGLELEHYELSNDPRTRRAALFTGLLLLLLAAGSFWFSRQQELASRATELNATLFPPAGLIILGCLFGCLALGYCCLVLLNHAQAANLLLLGGFTLFVVSTTHLLFPALSRRESVREFAELTRALAQPQERLVFFLNADHGFDFYAPELPLRAAKAEFVTAMAEADIDQLLAEQPTNSLLVITSHRWKDAILQRYEPLGKLGKLKGIERPYACSPACEWVVFRLQK